MRAPAESSSPWKQTRSTSHACPSLFTRTICPCSHRPRKASTKTPITAAISYNNTCQPKTCSARWRNYVPKFSGWFRRRTLAISSSLWVTFSQTLSLCWCAIRQPYRTQPGQAVWSATRRSPNLRGWSASFPSKPLKARKNKSLVKFNKSEWAKSL